MSGAYVPPGPMMLKPFAEPEDHQYRPDSVIDGQVTLSSNGDYRETVIDHVMAYNARITGMKCILKNHHWLDYAYVTVHSSGEGNPEVARFAEKYTFDDSKQDQDWIRSNYSAYLPQGFIIRVHYFT